MSGPGDDNLLNKAKRYSSLKYSLALLDIVYVIALLLIFLGLGISKGLAETLSNFTQSQYIVVPLFILIVSLAYYLLSFPLNFYSSYILEHKFSLSRQKLGDWFLDQAKAGIISYLIGLIFISVLYYVLKCYVFSWWWIISFIWIFFSLILARLTPVVIIPLFFKYKKLSDDNLRQRILRLADKMRIRGLDVFEIDFSKKTQKANAAFVGVGRTKRVILADTLRDKYSPDEIEVILAHEFAHYRLRHLLKLILVSSLATLLTFYFIFKTSNYLLGLFGLSSLLDIAALPVIFLYWIIFGIITQPLNNYISRRLERNADALALETTGLKEAFISTMDKLCEQNLADRKPHPLIKFFFFDHPPIDERITLAKGQVQS
ncbi:MAG: M48 family metallopeptidase [Candidatus Omnitrophica bacterium]|nr:M48 family metallopeptidase [Candidatus Omnitrophota bacterium]MDD5592118.1 M48 family metallopeptidase [Candidatus Omnitrophota bacterium]